MASRVDPLDLYDLRTGLWLSLAIGLLGGLLAGLLGFVGGWLGFRADWLIILVLGVTGGQAGVALRDELEGTIKLNAVQVLTGTLALDATIGFVWGGLLGGLLGGLVFGRTAAVAAGLLGGLAIGLVTGGSALLQHYIIRALLVRAGVAPWRYGPFLEAMADRLLLRRSGKAYLFAHGLLRDFLADINPHDTLASPRNAAHSR